MAIRSIPVWRGGEIAAKAVVDEEDFERVSQYKWRLVKDGKRRKLWQAQVMVNGKRVLQKHFKTEREAAEAAAAAWREFMLFSAADQAA
jgi:hypothetical protein